MTLVTGTTEDKITDFWFDVNREIVRRNFFMANPFPSLGDNLKRLRGNRSQAVFAKLCDIPQTSYANYELGTAVPGGEALYKIAVACGVSMEEVLTEKTFEMISPQSPPPTFPPPAGGKCAECATHIQTISNLSQTLSTLTQTNAAMHQEIAELRQHLRAPPAPPPPAAAPAPPPSSVSPSASRHSRAPSSSVAVSS